MTSTPEEQFLQAAISGETDRVKNLIAQGADVNFADRFQQSVLMAAVRKGNAEIVQLLLQAGADVNAVNRLNESVLMTAVQTNRAEIITLLLDAGADTQHKDNLGRNALQLAQEKNNQEIIHLLTAAAPMCMAQALLGKRPPQEEKFLRAVINEDIPYLTAHAQEINPAILSFLFVMSPSVPVCAALLEAGVSVNTYARIKVYSGPQSAPEDCTALYFACKYGLLPKAKWLLEHGADVEEGWQNFPESIDNSERDTPLKAAVAHADTALVSLLLKYHANVCNKDDSFYTALDIARQQKNPNAEIIALLQSAETKK